MKGSPAKMGTIKGTKGHTTALKWAQFIPAALSVLGSMGKKKDEDDSPTKQMIGPKNKPNYNNFSEEQRLANEASVKGSYIPGISHDPTSYSDATDMGAPVEGGTTQEKNRKTRWSIINQKKAAIAKKKAEEAKKMWDALNKRIPGKKSTKKQSKSNKDYEDIMKLIQNQKAQKIKKK